MPWGQRLIHHTQGHFIGGEAYLKYEVSLQEILLTKMPN